MPYAQAWPPTLSTVSITTGWNSTQAAAAFIPVARSPHSLVITNMENNNSVPVVTITFTPFDVKISDGVTMTDAARSFIKAVCEVAREGDAAACAGVKP